MRLKLRPVLSTAASLLASLLLASGTPALAQPQSQAQDIEASPDAAIIRITEPVANNTLVILKGNTHPLAQARYDEGAAPATLATGKLQLLLKRSPAQQLALRQYLDSAQDPHSATYHRWLTPAAYGARFGIADQDLQTVENWLGSEGFKVEAVPVSRNLIQFSGTVSQIAHTFHTGIHSYTIDGVRHYSNSTDPRIPAALAPVIAGLSPLNDFRAQPGHILGTSAQAQRSAGSLKILSPSSRGPMPLLVKTTGNPPGNALYVTPADAATIYNSPNALNSRYTGATHLTGAGVNIGLAEYSDLQTTDYANYRKLFLNASTPHDPHLVAEGVDPGVLDQHDGQITLVDAEITTGLAPDADIYVYSGQSDLLEDGLTNAIIRAIQDNTVSILSVSYTNCEASLGVSGNLEISELWQEAAAQGISVVVAAGNTGTAACDDGGRHSATGGRAVSGFASTPYNIAVGGTDFDTLSTSFDQYVNTASSGGSTPYHGSALGYIPENPWNDSIENNSLGSYTGNIAAAFGYGLGIITAGGGGASSLAYCAAGINPTTGNCTGALTGYPAPPFQSAVSAGAAAPSGVRYLPDVALFSGDMIQHPAGWAICSDNLVAQANYTFTDCSPAADGTFSVEGVGGTATSTAAFAGVLGMVIQSLGATTRLGVANNVLYNLHAMSSNAAIFHDVTVGNNSVPCTSGSTDCSSNGFINGYDATTGYDLASGLGSVDISALIAAWPTATFTPTTTSLHINGNMAPITITHGTVLTLAATVTPATATGTVSVTGTTGQGGAAVSQYIPLTGGTGSISTNTLPGGTYKIQGYYPGDVSHSPSTSAPAIQITVNPEDSQVLLSLLITDVNTGKTLTSSFNYGSYGFVYAQPKSATGSDGIATGTVTLLNNRATLGSQPLNSKGNAAFPVATFAPGIYSLGAAYSGDGSYNPSTTATDTAMSISKAPTLLSAAPAASALSTSAAATLTVTLATDSTGAFPTGGITLIGNGKSFTGIIAQSLNTLNAVQEIATFTVPGSALAAGTNTLTATYLGDANYNGSTTTVVLTVPNDGSNGPAFTLAGPSAGITVPAPGVSATGIVTITPTNGFTGAVNLSCSIATTKLTNPPTCSITPTATLAANISTTATLTINTAAPTKSIARLESGGPGNTPMRYLLAGAGSMALCSMLLFTIPARRHSWRSMLVALVAFGALGILGCGVTVGPGLSGTQVGTYTATVTGANGSTTGSTQVTITVQ